MGGARARSPRPRSATRCTSCSRGSTSRLREPPDDLADSVRARYPLATDEEIARIGGLVEDYCRSEIAQRLAGARGRDRRAIVRVRARRRASPRAPRRLPRGRRAALLVVDYKTNVLEDASPAEVVEREYGLQRLVYALACLRAGADRRRGRLPVPRAPRRAGHDTCLQGRGGAGSWRRSCRRRSRRSRQACSSRRRASTPARPVRRSTSSALRAARA